MIAVVVPTIRPESWERFYRVWKPLFQRHKVQLFKVIDGDDPVCVHVDQDPSEINSWKLSESDWKQLIFNKNDGVRNFGFLTALRVLGDSLQIILTLDDDVFPCNRNDPIQDHLDALFWEKNKYSADPTLWIRRVPISWFSTASEYMRGFPYAVREEAEVWVSHGVWQGVHDYDGPTQLVEGIKPASFYKGPIPKGCLTPVCGMSLAFRVQALPYVYFAPMGKALGVQRFADILMGVHLKRTLDELNKAIVTGYSTVYHERASNVFNNLEQEARGIKWNEQWWNDGNKELMDEEAFLYFKEYDALRSLWQELVVNMLEAPNDNA